MTGERLLRVFLVLKAITSPKRMAEEVGRKIEMSRSTQNAPEREIPTSVALSMYVRKLNTQ